jgi:hypothetical protein
MFPIRKVDESFIEKAPWMFRSIKITAIEGALDVSFHKDNSNKQQ